MRRRENSRVKSVMEWKQLGKRPRERPRRRWIDSFEEDLREMVINSWRELVYDRDRYRNVVLAAKLLESYKSHKKKTTEFYVM